MSNLSDTPPILTIEQLDVGYPDAPLLVSRWSATIGAGITLIFGDTGSGKSTVLRALAGQMACRGDLAVTGVRLADGREAYRSRVFFVDPATDAFNAMPCRDCTSMLTAGAPFDAARWQSLVDGFNLAEHIDKPMFMLSTGSRRKVWLAAALASDRPLTLLDDPTAALDAGSIRCLWHAVTALATDPTRAFVIASSEPALPVQVARCITLPL